MATLMRCTQSHWQGDKFIPAGTVRPAGHKEVIPAFFEPFSTEDEEPEEPKPAKKTAAKPVESP